MQGSLAGALEREAWGAAAGGGVVDEPLGSSGGG